MNTAVGTWRDGQLVAKPRRNDIPDPLDPEWKEQVYIRNLGGAVKPVPKWIAYDMIQNHRAVEATEDEYYDYEQQYDGNIQQPQPSMVKKEISKVEENKSDQVLESIGQLNKKFGQLTDAILQLAQKNQSTNQVAPQVKKRGRPAKGVKHGINR